MRRARYRTLAKVRLEHVAIAVGISLQRLDDWWGGIPRASSRTSRFAALAIDRSGATFPNSICTMRKGDPCESECRRSIVGYAASR